MQAVLIILFILLWKFNTNICSFYYPGDLNDYDVWKPWYYLRCQIYEVMFFIAVLIPFGKATRFSKAAALFGLVYIGASLIDKSQGIFNEKIRDWMVVIPCAVAISYMTYYKNDDK